MPANGLYWLKLAIDNNVNLSGTVQKAVLIDAGIGNAQADKIKKYMKKMGISKLNYTVLSHYNQDHFGGFAKLLRTYKTIPYEV
ncbi:MBL fold metallo-hydrolase [Chitinophaga sp. Cy-1792]|uniref:MBL fold metallo-hydrolase n=1 Tax=Chitinophaga sp. Cy-1792 TaxID=2608339 RepID=UPI001423DE7F